MLKPDEFVERVAKNLWQNDRFNTNEPWEKVKGTCVEEYWTRKAKEAVRLVLQEIRNGEVYSIKYKTDHVHDAKIVLNQPFTDWMEKNG